MAFAGLAAGFAGVCRALVELGGADVNLGDVSAGFTPLHWAGGQAFLLSGEVLGLASGVLCAKGVQVSNRPLVR